MFKKNTCSKFRRASAYCRHHPWWKCVCFDTDPIGIESCIMSLTQQPFCAKAVKAYSWRREMQIVTRFPCSTVHFAHHARPVISKEIGSIPRCLLATGCWKTKNSRKTKHTYTNFKHKTFEKWIPFVLPESIAELICMEIKYNLIFALCLPPLAYGTIPVTLEVADSVNRISPRISLHFNRLSRKYLLSWATS